MKNYLIIVLTGCRLDMIVDSLDSHGQEYRPDTKSEYEEANYKPVKRLLTNADREEWFFARVNAKRSHTLCTRRFFCYALGFSSYSHKIILI